MQNLANNKWVYILLKALLILIIVAFICSLIPYIYTFLTGGAITDDYFTHMLHHVAYILGIGDLSKTHLGWANIMAIVGLVGTTIFTARLTVNLFWRLMASMRWKFKSNIGSCVCRYCTKEWTAPRRWFRVAMQLLRSVSSHAKNLSTSSGVRSQSDSFSIFILSLF